VDFTQEGFAVSRFLRPRRASPKLAMAEHGTRNLSAKRGEYHGLEARSGYQMSMSGFWMIRATCVRGCAEWSIATASRTISLVMVLLWQRPCRKTTRSPPLAKHFAVHRSYNKGGHGEQWTDPQTSPREVENIFLPGSKSASRCWYLGCDEFVQRLR